MSPGCGKVAAAAAAAHREARMAMATTMKRACVAAGLQRKGRRRAVSCELKLLPPLLLLLPPLLPPNVVAAELTWRWMYSVSANAHGNNSHHSNCRRLLLRTLKSKLSARTTNATCRIPDA